jgi:hypothetical protein
VFTYSVGEKLGSLTQKEEHRLTEFENRNTTGPNGKTVIAVWKKNA